MADHLFFPKSSFPIAHYLLSKHRERIGKYLSILETVLPRMRMKASFTHQRQT